jgi:6-phosphogluconate dehydrogenase
MKIGFVGLGRMGANMVERLTKAGHDIVAFDLNESARTSVAAKGATVVEALADVIPALTPPRVVWVMVPAGRPTQETVEMAGAKSG